MLKVTIPNIELFDEATMEFRTIKEQTIQLEHSLVSISKWEQKYCKPFMSKEKKTTEESIDYIRCMTITQNVDPSIYNYITQEDMIRISEYIDHPMTATTVSRQKQPPNRKVITAEIIYYWMIALQIPWECQKWHLNKLITLINVCDAENNPKKMSKRETMAHNRALNNSRRQQMGTRG